MITIAPSRAARRMARISADSTSATSSISDVAATWLVSSPPDAVPLPSRLAGSDFVLSGGGGTKFAAGSPGYRTMLPSASMARRRRRKFHEHEVVKSKLLLKM
jgi:hypothetical protein